MFCLNKMIMTFRKRTILTSLIISVLIVHTIFQENTSTNSNLNRNTSSLQEILGCSDINSSVSYFGQRGSYWVLYNYFKPTRNFRCDESITYTTHADFTFLDNLVPLLKRWQGPLSIALYAPGSDFKSSVRKIQYLRECILTTLIKDLVTFHLIFDQDHMPSEEMVREPEKLTVNCNILQKENSKVNRHTQTYKKVNVLTYPINVARNVARETAKTHFVFPSDIELYPSPGLILNFIEMIARNNIILDASHPKVFVIPVFEVNQNITNLPNNKSELVSMLNNKSAIPFHKYVCKPCHMIPKFKKWMQSIDFQQTLNVFHVEKRKKPFGFWEPFYIGTKFDPIFDERLSWEGQMDKMTQGYILCVMDYEFLILDNAFLIHKPGIKRRRHIGDQLVIKAQTRLIQKKILPELNLMYGTRPGCVL